MLIPSKFQGFSELEKKFGLHKQLKNDKYFEKKSLSDKQSAKLKKKTKKKMCIPFFIFGETTGFLVFEKSEKISEQIISLPLGFVPFTTTICPGKIEKSFALSKFNFAKIL